MSSEEITAILTALPISESDRNKAQTIISTAAQKVPEFDFNELVEKFSKVCIDYKSELQSDTQSCALEFSENIIYEVGPEAKQVIKSGGKEMYRFNFAYSESNFKVAFITTLPTQIPETPTRIILSVKQAMLLAINTLEKMNQLQSQQTQPVYKLTPLASAIFLKEDIPKISARLGISSCEVAHIMNASSFSGGQYLPNSSLACAIVCVLMTTKRLRNNFVKVKIISKTIGAYLSQKKAWDVKAFEVFSEFPYGNRMPDVETLVDTLERIQLQAGQAAEAAAGSSAKY